MECPKCGGTMYRCEWLAPGGGWNCTGCNHEILSVEIAAKSGLSVTMHERDDDELRKALAEALDGWQRHNDMDYTESRLSKGDDSERIAELRAKHSLATGRQ